MSIGDKSGSGASGAHFAILAVDSYYSGTSIEPGGMISEAEAPARVLKDEFWRRIRG